MKACSVWLDAKIAVVQPQAFIALGATATRELLGAPLEIERESGRWLRRADGRPVLIARHPSTLMRAQGPLDENFARWLAVFSLASIYL